MIRKLIYLFVFLSLWSNIVFANIIEEIEDIPDMHQPPPNTANPLVRNFNLGTVQASFEGLKETESVSTYYYESNRIYKIPLRKFIHTVIKLPENEVIKDFVLGDSVNFKTKLIKSNDNAFEVWGIMPGADTNLTVLGKSGNIYPFYLRNYAINDSQTPDLVVYIKGYILPLADTQKEIKEEKESEVITTKKGDCEDCNKEGQFTKQSEKLSGDYLRELPNIDLTKLNYNYVPIKGDKTLAPIRVFDDGHFTYFQFQESGYLDQARLPAIYAVIDSYDTPVNYRVEGSFMIATATNLRWTLRSGQKFLCIKKNVPKKKKFWWF